jgi:hypothetical protein
MDGRQLGNSPAVYIVANPCLELGFQFGTQDKMDVLPSSKCLFLRSTSRIQSNLANWPGSAVVLCAVRSMRSLTHR